jgi:hypothetical protein
VTASMQALAAGLRTGCVVLVIAWVLPTIAQAQSESTTVVPAPCACMDSVSAIHPLQEAVAMFLLPKLLQDSYLLKQYIVSDDFSEVRRVCGDRAAVDVLFRRALRTSWNNPYLTLAVMTLAVFDHRRFGVRVPLLGPVLWFPLTSEFAEEFAARREALPSRLYPDTPSYGDRDKLQHFFGSAFLAMITNSHETVDRIGAFIEWGEDRFIVGGTLEQRDMEADSRGGLFGLAFLEDRSVHPSAYMTVPLSMPFIDSVQVHEKE